jgi:hypothetical protein
MAGRRQDQFTAAQVAYGRHMAPAFIHRTSPTWITRIAILTNPALNAFV